MEDNTVDDRPGCTVAGIVGIDGTEPWHVRAADGAACRAACCRGPVFVFRPIDVSPSSVQRRSACDRAVRIRAGVTSPICMTPTSSRLVLACTSLSGNRAL
jgi:hypothetical protein